jgi:type I restriction enzyme, S subunit
MKSSYKALAAYIEPVNQLNDGIEVEELLGISNQKYFQNSHTNTIDIDLQTYRIVRSNQFAYNRATTRNGDKISIALRQGNDCIVSPSYRIFRSKDESELNSEFLMMWFRRPEFDRYARFKSHGSAHEFFEYDQMCQVELPVPPIDKQREIVKEYNVIQNRIALNQQLIQKLEETAQAIFNSYFENKDESENHRLGDLIEIKGGFSYNTESLGKGNTYLLGMGCVSFTDRYVEDGMRLYSNNVPEQHVVKPKDIVIATRQQSENLPILGCPAMIPPNLADKKMVIASNLYRVVNKSKLSIELIYQILKSKNYQEHIKLHTKGTTVGMITKDAIEDYVFEGPSTSILYSIQDNINKIIDNIFLKRTENQKLTELKNLQLSKLATIEN